MNRSIFSLLCASSALFGDPLETEELISKEVVAIPLVTQKLASGLGESALKSTTAGFATAPVLIQYEGDRDRQFQDTLTQPRSQFLSDERYTSFLQQSIVPQEMQLSLPDLEPRAQKSSFLAVSLTGILPGLGHAYLGDLQTAGGLLGSTWVGLGLGYGLNSSNESKEFIRSTSFLTAQTTWFYGLYAAYRDVRNFNGQSNYAYKMPTDSFADLSMAPFSLRVLKKPEVWGGLLGSLAIAVGAAYFAFPREAQIPPALSLGRTLLPVTAFPVGIGEESFFRGFLQSQFSEWLTPWGGIALSSLVFGAMHVPNAFDLDTRGRRGYYTTIIPLITLFGFYEGWLTYKNHSLKESVALHAWYDFVIFAIGSLATQKALKGRMEFSVAVPF